MNEIVIKSIAGRELFRAEAEDLRAALIKAVAARANLDGANLDGANLDGANLDRANLDGANLARANLAGANLARANLAGANLDGANLDRANLARAYLAGSAQSEWLAPIRADLRAVLDLAPHDVDGLADALRGGRVDGLLYEGTCACLVGTIAKVRGCHYQALGDLKPDADRPAERWFARIRPGHTPLNSTAAAMALAWIAEWKLDADSRVMVPHPAEAAAP